MKKEIYIHSFTPIMPLHHLPQSKTVDWILNSHMRSGGDALDIAKLRRYCLNDQYIQTRYFECDDVDDDWENHQIYKITNESPEGVSIAERNKFFGLKADRVFSELYKDKIPSHIVHVSCTGYLSPSPPQRFFSKKERSPDITHAYHMGCYASLPSIRMAMGLYLGSGNEIDIVHTEMCSLHLSSSEHTPEQMVVQTLFADGHIKYCLGQEKKGFKILSIMEKLVPDTLEDMTWIPGPFGMIMTLSREVPFKIRDALPGFINELCQKGGIRKEDVLANGIFSIHPGGPKIIEAVQKKMELKDDQVRHSKKVLTERGNMSSSTLPHVWYEILKDSPGQGTIVLSLAFGPGLTIFGSIFEVA